MKVTSENVHKLKPARRALYVGALERSEKLLSNVTTGAFGMDSRYFWDNVTKRLTFPESDVWKNAALAAVRFHVSAAKQLRIFHGVSTVNPTHTTFILHFISHTSSKQLPGMRSL